MSRFGTFAARVRDDDRGVAASIVLFPLFAAVVFMFVQGAWWQISRQTAAAAADRASQSVALYGYPPGEAESIAIEQMTSGGLRDVSVSISRGEEFTVVEVSGTAPGLLAGMSTTVSARAVTPTEDWQD